jgi:hypothetical protein
MKTVPRPWTVAVEATIFSGWIYDHLLPHADQMKVAHPLMLRAIGAAKKKNDRIDAGKIADCLRASVEGRADISHPPCSPPVRTVHNPLPRCTLAALSRICDSFGGGRLNRLLFPKRVPPAARPCKLLSRGSADSALSARCVHETPLESEKNSVETFVPGPRHVRLCGHLAGQLRGQQHVDAVARVAERCRTTGQRRRNCTHGNFAVHCDGDV